jgi:DNA-directed RNA polymerase specialized sigma24 family protein
MNSIDQFDTIVCENYEPLFRFAMSLTRTESDAWDLTQHKFYVWPSKGHQLRDLSKAKTWLFTVSGSCWPASKVVVDSGNQSAPYAS